jgi:hypothetical protein
MTSEERLKNLSDIVKKLKIAIYTLVNEYRRLIHIANFGNKDFSKMCRVTNGEVDENGNIFVTKDVLEDFTNRFRQKCANEALFWCQYIPSLDIFVKNILSFEDPSFLLKTKNKQLQHLYECWFGDIYKDKQESAFLLFLRDIENKKSNINVEMFKDLNKQEEESLLHGLPL